MKYYGNIGFAEAVETAPDVWTEKIIERPYRGDVIQFNRRWQNGVGTVDDINISNKIEIVSDTYMNNFIGFIRYVTWRGMKWKVTDVSIGYPRITLSIGGLYNDVG